MQGCGQLLLTGRTGSSPESSSAATGGHRHTHTRTHTDRVHVHMTAVGITRAIIGAAACQRKVPLLLIFSPPVSRACRGSSVCSRSERKRRFSLFHQRVISRREAVCSSGCRLPGELTEPAARQPKLCKRACVRVWQMKGERSCVPFVRFRKVP